MTNVHGGTTRRYGRGRAAPALLFLLGLLAAGVPGVSHACGKERWAVKTGTDPDASRIDLRHGVATTVAKLDALPAPVHLPRDRRIPPVETTVYRVHATLIAYKHERDGDYHLVLRGRSGQTMITEIPAPSCVGSGSPLARGIARARHEFNARFHAEDHSRYTRVPVTVTGVGFFDFPHGQMGVAPNAIELHPVLNVTFGKR